MALGLAIHHEMPQKFACTMVVVFSWCCENFSVQVRSDNCDLLERTNTYPKEETQQHTITTMAQGKAIPEAIHWIIIRLSTVMSAEEISMYTDVGVRKVNEIIMYFNQTGGVKLSRCMKCQLHQTLCDYDIEVCNTLPLRLTVHFDLKWSHTAPLCNPQ